MIVVQDVHKRYQTDHGPGKWVLQGVSFTIPEKTNVGLVGKNGAGKSTLLRLIGGVDVPTKGAVERRCRVSWPMGFGGGLQGSLTGRQNAKFVCRIHGHADDIPERLARIAEFAELGPAFDDPVKTYSSGMKSRLQFALSLAFDFDVYISDEVTSTGDAAFRAKAAAAFKSLADRAGLIMVSHGEGVLKQFCQAGIWLHEGRAHWFDNIDDALKAYKESQALPAEAGKPPAKPQHPLTAKLNRLRSVFKLLEDGINGQPATAKAEDVQRWIGQARQVGIELLPLPAITRRGFKLNEGATPVLRKQAASGDRQIDLYDLHSQCTKAENA